jgi:hypothetical protein
MRERRTVIEKGADKGADLAKISEEKWKRGEGKRCGSKRSC